jgi:biopolymer transport protein ExbD
MNLTGKRNGEPAGEQSWHGAVSDIAFLLIIFFILTASFTYTRMVDFSIDSDAGVTGSDRLQKRVELISDELCLSDGMQYTYDTLADGISSDNSYIISIRDTVSYSSLIKVLDLFADSDIKVFEIEL